MATTGTAVSTAVPEDEPAWHTLSAADVLERLDVPVSRGLTDAEAAARLERHGRNELAKARRQPAWRRILALLTDRMTLVLLAAALVSALVERELETPIVILLVIGLNTVLNFLQESRAENSLEALRDATVSHTLVRRDGVEREVASTELVPGDLVLLDAGDAVPADGRLVEAVRLQVAQAALTGESEPVDKNTDALDEADEPAAERSDMVFMNTEVSRGRAVMVVTGTGMGTQIGHVARALGSAQQEKTPLQRRTDALAGTLTVVALVVVAIVFVIGLIRGQSWSDLLVTAVSLAVATIPEGLTAVVAFTLAIGSSRLAQRGAIVKRLSAVETLGSTTHIATDKTGTLTLNQMTAQRLLMAGRSFKVSGDGYSTQGQLLTSDHRAAPGRTEAYWAMALCNDATVADDGSITGDPTEAALVVLAEKGGVDVEGARRAYPRTSEVPFDSDYKFMATFHAAGPDDEDQRTWCFAKGAPGVLMHRADSYHDGQQILPLEQDVRGRFEAKTDELAAEGLRTIAIAGRRMDAGLPSDGDELRDSVQNLTMYAVVGILDPPREQARDAIAEAHRAGISVHMITGDNRLTAATIAASLGIDGETANGSDLDDLSDEELAGRASGYGVLARVSPQHKIRFVTALQQSGGIVAMTGDGVNDAPALKKADIGVAMGITGTDVSKGAADMILTDDNFATIITAVEGGRAIYANIIKFVKFQLTTAWGFVLIFLTCSVLGIAGGAPFTALQILLVNLIMDGPPALALGVDRPEPGLMDRPPRPPSERLLTRDRLVRIVTLGVVMCAGTVLVLDQAEAWFPDSAGEPLFATSLAFATFVLYQVFNLLNVRSDTESLFSLSSFTNRYVWLSVAAVLLLLVAVLNVEVLQGAFDTTSLTSTQWLTAALVASSVLAIEEVRKLVARLRQRRRAGRDDAELPQALHPDRGRVRK